MIAVIFEFQPADGRRDDYLDLAAELAPLLREEPGFLGVERFESLTRPGRYLSLSFWTDEDAVTRWRSRAEHRGAQDGARGGILADYRLRVAAVIRDYSAHDRDQAPADSRARDAGDMGQPG